MTTENIRGAKDKLVEKSKDAYQTVVDPEMRQQATSRVTGLFSSFGSSSIQKFKSLVRTEEKVVESEIPIDQNLKDSAEDVHDSSEKVSSLPEPTDSDEEKTDSIREVKLRLP